MKSRVWTPLLMSSIVTAECSETQHSANPNAVVIQMTSQLTMHKPSR